MRLILIIFVGSICHDFIEGATSRKNACDRYEKSCDDGKCISAMRFCDQIVDCTDRSDELDCVTHYCDTKRSFICKNKDCISNTLVCDGKYDCEAGDDEVNCGTTECLEGFPCSNGRCILKAWHCDGNPDCPDGGDEKNCTVSDGHCPPFHFTCKNMKCIPLQHRCDGSNDCDDGDDEEHCVEVDNCFEVNGLFLCKDNKTCLRRTALCDSNTDCADGSDEGGDCGVECKNQCEHECYKTPSGPKCHCNKGFNSEFDSGSCKDIDECNLEMAVCDHFCTNTEGDFNCSCDVGYQLVNKTACVCNHPGPQALMIFSVGNDIEARVLGKKSWKVFKGIYKVSSVAYDPIQNMVYWVSEDNTIYRKRIDVENIYQGISSDHDLTTSEIFINQVGTLKAEQLALDWFGRNLYITDYSHNHILACSLLLRNCMVLLQDIAHPRSIQVDLENRYMYYSDVEKGTIEKVAMDGSSRNAIIENDVDWPNGIALDPPAQRLYWLDAKLDAVESADYYGRNRKKLPQAEVTHPFSLAIWESKLYWTEWMERGQMTHQSIQGCRKIDGKNQIVEYRNAYNAVNGITIHHSSMFQNVYNPCKQAKCADMCLLSPTEDLGYACVCPFGKELDPTGHSCKETTSVKLLAAVSHLGKIKFLTITPRQYGIDEATEVKVHNATLTTVSRIAFSPSNNVAYMIDGEGGNIFALNMTTMQFDMIHATNDIIIAIAVDFVRHNIYYATSYSISISVLNPEKRIVNALQGNFTHTTDLAVDVVKRYLFISDYGRTVAKGCIHKCSLSGDHCMVIIKDIRPPSSIAVDQALISPRLYWTSRYGQIWSALYDGSYQIRFEKEISDPVFVTIGNQYVFWMSGDGRSYGTVDKADPEKYKVTSKGVIAEGKFLAMQMLNSPDIYPIDSCKKANCQDFCFPVDDTNYVCKCSNGHHVKDGTCEKRNCSVGRRQCNSGECIPKSSWCDHHKDCVDGSDEQECENLCTISSYSCDDGTCILREAVCDGFKDCADGSDEDDERCRKCDPDNDWQCRDGECIPRYWRCDSKIQCKDKSDEEDCHQNICDENSMKCNNGLCINISWKCDGSKDCRDGEDEENCTCSADEFQCKSGLCIQMNATCDGINNCADGSDETVIACASRVLWIDQQCAYPLTSCGDVDNTICISQEQQCDGKKDCPTGEDEDEGNCFVTCRQSETKCPSEDICIPNVWICDGHHDCSDGSDEADCNELGRAFTHSFYCPLEQFKCSDNSCIPINQVCDGISDCPSDDDELGHCNDCNNGNGGCKHICNSHPIKAYCTCEPGFKLASDHQTCEDIDECTDEFSCHHQCTNIKGGFFCSCYEGYDLTSDNHTCKAIAKERSFAAIAHDGYIKLINEKFLEVAVGYKLPGNVSQDHMEVDYEYKNKTFIVLDKRRKIFYQQNGTNWVKLNFDVSKPFLLTVDDDRSNIYIVEKLYWQNKTFNIIKICSLRTQACRIINRISKGNVTAIMCLSPLQKVFFCVKTEHAGHLISMDLIGNSRTIHQEKMRSCDALDVDSKKGRVYFADNVLGTIESIGYLGHGNNRLFTKHIKGVAKLSNLHHSLLWQNFPARKMFSCPFDKTSGCKEIMFHGILLGSVHNDIEIVDDKCSTANCLHICTTDHYSANCLCPDGFHSGGNHSICKKMENADRIIQGLKCSDSPCNNGTCIDESFQIICKCHEPYIGMFCEHEARKTYAFMVMLVLVGMLIVLIICYVLYQKRDVILGKRNMVLGNYRFRSQRQGLIVEEEIPEPTVTEVLSA